MLNWADVELQFADLWDIRRNCRLEVMQQWRQTKPQQGFTLIVDDYGYS